MFICVEGGEEQLKSFHQEILSMLLGRSRKTFSRFKIHFAALRHHFNVSIVVEGRKAKQLSRLSSAKINKIHGGERKQIRRRWGGCVSFVIARGVKTSHKLIKFALPLQEILIKLSRCLPPRSICLHNEASRH